MGADSIRFLPFFQRVNSNQGNGFSIVFKRDRHLSHFSCVASTRNCNTMLGICVEELFFCAEVNPSRKLFGDLS